MAVPSNHTLIPLNIMGVQILESMLDMKFTISNKTIFRLHLLLRHSDEVDHCDTGGFFRASYVLAYFHTTLDKLINTVYNNNKNRYQFSICDDHLYIRACQGHSGKILDKLVPEHIYDIYSSDDNVFHRTTSEVSDRFSHRMMLPMDYAQLGDRYIWQLVRTSLVRVMTHPIKIIVNVKKAREPRSRIIPRHHNGVIFII